MDDRPIQEWDRFRLQCRGVPPFAFDMDFCSHLADKILNSCFASHSFGHAFATPKNLIFYWFRLTVFRLCNDVFAQPIVELTSLNQTVCEIGGIVRDSIASKPPCRTEAIHHFQQHIAQPAFCLPFIEAALRETRALSGDDFVAVFGLNEFKQLEILIQAATTAILYIQGRENTDVLLHPNVEAFEADTFTYDDDDDILIGRKFGRQPRNHLCTQAKTVVLFETSNLMRIANSFILGQFNRNRIMNIASRLCECVEYETGSGNSVDSILREALCIYISGSTGQYPYSKSIFNNLKDGRKRWREDETSEFADMVSSLGVNINGLYGGYHGKSLLRMAAEHNQRDNAIELLSLGVNVNTINRHGMTALHEAAIRGHVSIAKLLLENGANHKLEEVSKGLSALHISCGSGNIDMVNLLLQYGASVYGRNINGDTPLHVACMCGDMLAAEALLRHGAASVANFRNKNNCTPFELCRRDDHRSYLETLVFERAVTEAVSMKEKCWNRSKIMIVGQGRAGKSSLARVIMGHAFCVESPSTCGVDKFEVNVSMGTVEHGNNMHGQWQEYKKEGSHLNNALASMARNVTTQISAEGEQLDILTNGSVFAFHDDDETISSISGPVANNVMSAEGDQLDIFTIGCVFDSDDGTVSNLSNPLASNVSQFHHAQNNSNAPVEDTANASQSQFSHRMPHLPHLPIDISFIAKARAVKDSELLLSLFDFGGQDIFNCVHPFFLSANGAYVVVFNMTEFFQPSTRQECLRYLMFWINSVAMHTKRGQTMSDIYIVGTHSDKVTNQTHWVQIAETLRRTLSASLAWPFVVKDDSYLFFPVDCTIGMNDAVAQKLVQVILSRIKESTFVLDKRPLTWFSVLDDLENVALQRSMISLAEVEAIGRTYAIAIEELISLLKYFREMGVLLWYDNPASLRDAVILNPVTHFIDPVTQIICDPQIHPQEVHVACRNRFPDSKYQTFRSTGILEVPMLKFMLGFGGHDATRLIEMMQMYGLLVRWQPVQSKSSSGEAVDIYLVPSLFPALVTKNESSISSCTSISCNGDPCLEIQIPHPRLSHWDCSRAFFLVFSLDPQLPKRLLRRHQLQECCFLPAGIFEQLICSVLVWSQYTPDSALSNYKLQKRMLEVCFGNVKFCMTLRSRHNCIQVDVLGQQAHSILARLTALVKEIIVRTGYSIFMEPFVTTNPPDTELLISCKSLVGGGCELDGAAVRPESVLISNNFDWILDPSLQANTFDVFLSYRWNELDQAFVLKLYDYLQDYTINDKKISVFCDRERFQESDAIRPTLFKSLLKTTVVAPVVSTMALQRMMNHDASVINNLLFEWLTSVMLTRLRPTLPHRIALERVMPTVLLQDLNGNVFVDLLPRIVKVNPSATVAAVLSSFADSRIDLPSDLREYAVTATVDQIVKDLLGSIYALGDDIHDKCLPCRVAARAVNAIQKTESFAWGKLDVLSLLTGRLERYRDAFIQHQVTAEILQVCNLDDHETFSEDVGVEMKSVDAKLFLSNLKKALAQT